MIRTSRALRFSFATRYLGSAAALVSSLIIARLLTPEEIGIFSLAAGLVSLSNLFRDFGAAQYVIQERELTDQRIRAAFTVNLACSWIIAVALVAVAAPFAQFYREPIIRPVMLLLAVNFALLPFGSITMAILQRNMLFGRRMVVQTSAAVTQATVAVLGAYWGHGVMALAVASVASAAVTVVVALLLRPSDTPVLPGLHEVRRVLRIGSHFTLNSGLNHISNIAPELIVGRMIGLEAVGHIARGWGAIRHFRGGLLRGIDPVLYPLLADIHRNAGDVGAAYARSMVMISAVLWPFFGCLTLLGTPMIVTVFGQQWVLAGELVEIWAYGGLLMTLVQFAPQLLLATGNVHTLTRAQLLLTTLRIAMLLWSATISLQAVAMTTIPMALMRIALLTPHTSRLSGITLMQLLRECRGSALATVFAVAGAYGATAWLDTAAQPVLSFVAGGAGAVVLWAVTLVWMRHPLVPLIAKVLIPRLDRDDSSPLGSP